MSECLSCECFLKNLSLLLLKDPEKRLSNRLVVLVVDDGTVAAKVHWIILPLTWPLTEFTIDSDWRKKMQMTKGTGWVWKMYLSGASYEKYKGWWWQEPAVPDHIVLLIVRSYLLYCCQGVIVKDSWNELHIVVVICANISRVVASLWCEAERQMKEVYTRAWINCVVSCGSDSVGDWFIMKWQSWTHQCAVTRQCGGNVAGRLSRQLNIKVVAIFLLSREKEAVWGEWVAGPRFRCT